MKKPNRIKPIISALEPRILFDGAAVATAVEALDNSNFDTALLDQNVTPAAVESPTRDKNEIAFIDSGVDGYESIVDDLGEGVNVYILNADSNGLDQIASILENLDDIDAIHIISHGDVGEVTLGNTILDADTMASSLDVLASIGESLTDSGDILLYGCSVAENGDGESFVDAIADATGADVSASDDITGAESLGGDWSLEYDSGTIDVADLSAVNYQGQLGSPSISGLDDTNIFVEGGGPIVIDNDVLFSGGNSYTEGGLLFSLDNPDTTETLTLTSSDNFNDAGEISLIGDEVYLGNGTGRDRIGVIDSTFNGENGQDLKILFSIPLDNGNFEDGDASWDIVSGEYRGAALEDNLDLDGYAIPLATNSDSDSTYTGGTGTVNLQAQNLNRGGVVFTGEVVSDEGDNALLLTSDGRIVNGDQDPSQGGIFQDDGFGSIHGSYATSSVVDVKDGDSISLDFKAVGSGDDYEVFGILRKVDPITGAFLDTASYGTDNTENNIILFAERGADTNGYVTVGYENLLEGTYKFQFVGGTYDASGGKVVGSNLYVDNIRLFSSTVIDDAVVSKIAQQVTYDTTAAAISEVQTITITATSEEGLSDSDFIIIEMDTLENDAPILSDVTETITDTSTTDVFADITGNLTTSDVDDDTFTYDFLDGSTTQTGTYGTLSLSNDGSYTFEPNDDAINALSTNTTESFTIRVTDSGGGVLTGGVLGTTTESDTATFTIELIAVNDAPIATTIPPQTKFEDFADYSIDLKEYFSDVETSNADLTYTVSGNSDIGVTIVDGIATFTSATDNFNGVENISFTATDPGGESVTQTIVFTVNPVNDAPTLADVTTAITDTAAADSFDATTGTLTATDV
ncbi:DUF4347 domain-containing protein, partial [Psychromonas sp. SP041]|uniref:DUF4347 domain-containing protein n=1 Tax=Psychromonas sp. SP041 TaxID=1365007 RepID=UPI0010C78200